VAGCDDIPFASYVEPVLATINVPKAEMGKLAAEMLCDILNNRPCEDHYLKTTFKAGASIGHA
jgi:DNA-binding LacI/PurR family transcriptional regulator